MTANDVTGTPSAEFWDARYRDTDPTLGTRPNAVLVDVVTALVGRAGTALDIGCGHGGDALWLASLGWRVTAVDVAAPALERVDATAAARGVADRVTTERHDLSRSFPEGSFDLVSACYFHTPVDIPRDAVLRRAAGAVAPGGLLVVVEHASVAPWSSYPDGPPDFPSPQQTLDALHLDEGWRPERVETPQRVATGPGDRTATVTDNIIAVRRVTS